MKKQISNSRKVNGKPKNVPFKKTATSKVPQTNGKKKTVDKKWAKLSLDEFINSSASEDDSSSVENNSVEDENNSDADISDGSGEDEELLDDEEDDMEEGETDEDEGDDEDDGDDEDEGDDEDNEEVSEDDEDDEAAVKKHKKTLEKLKNTDPEFYQFLSENDRELLEFGSSESEDDEKGELDHEGPKPEGAEMGSDESDFEDKESTAKRQGNSITQAMVDNWQQKLQDPKYLSIVKKYVEIKNLCKNIFTDALKQLLTSSVLSVAPFIP